MRLAFTTFAILHEPYGHPAVQEFDDRTPYVFRAAEISPGFIARAVEIDDSGLPNFERNWGAWGTFQVPRFYTLGRELGTDQRASTLSIWRDVQSVFDFAYGGLHLRALKKREHWFKKPAWPTYACWWIDDAGIPTWSDACDKLEYLHDHGPTPGVFNFHSCFDEHGNPLMLATQSHAG
ncbi:DUF3291 domain-containing protein [Paraburkholderia sp. BCC1876]|uniref:DUF3291 domain-containing protein n=1 Tax=Paraburkholderia sp. BCC1876 TaxID=2676303 RepID=UPI001ABB3219|nr:DUF3291 domain-containing protein [Paraburkholderia sp. BCC1876]